MSGNTYEIYYVQVSLPGQARTLALRRVIPLYTIKLIAILNIVIIGLSVP